MAEELLDRIRAEIRERLKATEAAVREFERLEAALDVLGGFEDAKLPRRRRPLAAADTRPAPRRGTARRKRAPRGANREAALRVIGERPGVSVTELSAASGVGKSVLYNLLKTLEKCGDVAREQLPGGGTGYRLGDGAATEAAAEDADAS